MNPLFSGPYLLNTWSTEFSYHEIVHMIYMVDNMEHFNCAHACWFLHNVPTESDDVRIISCSLCREIPLLLCQKRKGLGDTKGFRGWGWFPGLRPETNLTSHFGVKRIREGEASSVPRNSCVERLEKSPVILKKPWKKKYKKPNTHFHFTVVFVLLHITENFGLNKSLWPMPEMLLFDRTNIMFTFLFFIFVFKLALFFLSFHCTEHASLRLYYLYR